MAPPPARTPWKEVKYGSPACPDPLERGKIWVSRGGPDPEKGLKRCPKKALKTALNLFPKNTENVSFGLFPVFGKSKCRSEAVGVPRIWNKTDI